MKFLNGLLISAALMALLVGCGDNTNNNNNTNGTLPNTNTDTDVSADDFLGVLGGSDGNISVS